MAEVRLEGLQRRVGSVEIIPDLTLTVHDGEFFTLVGPSGCGKSTLLHMIAGLDCPTSGRILFDGREVTGLAPRERDVALVFQNYALYPHMTVAENLAFPLRVGARAGTPSTDSIQCEVRAVARQLALESLLERRPRELSGGQRQRVALGRALIRRPSVFLLDEPLSNLDAQLRSGMRTELRRLHDELGITMIYVTHDQTEAMTLSDRLGVLDHGRLQQVGTPQDVYDRPRTAFVAGFIGHPSMNTLDAHIEGDQAVAGSIRMPIPMEVVLETGSEVTIGVRPEEIVVDNRLAEGFARDVGRASGHHAGQHDGQPLTGTVRLVEPTGGQVWVTCEVGQRETAAEPRYGAPTLIGLAGKQFKGRPGDQVAVSLAGARPHFFDATTGRRLGS